MPVATAASFSLAGGGVRMPFTAGIVMLRAVSGGETMRQTRLDGDRCGFALRWWNSPSAGSGRGQEEMAASGVHCFRGYAWEKVSRKEVQRRG